MHTTNDSDIYLSLEPLPSLGLDCIIFITSVVFIITAAVFTHFKIFPSAVFKQWVRVSSAKVLALG